jgi:hypothetical protein
MSEQTIQDMATALSAGVNVFEEIGKLYCQVKTQEKAIGLAIAALQEMSKPSETADPIAVPVPGHPDFPPDFVDPDQPKE